MSLVISHLLNHQRDGWDEQKLNNIFDARQSKKSQSVFVLREIDGLGLLQSKVSSQGNHPIVL